MIDIYMSVFLFFIMAKCNVQTNAQTLC